MPSAEEIVATGGAITAFVTGVVTGIVKAVQVSARLAVIEQELKALRSQTDAAKIERLRAASDSDPPDDSDAIAELRAQLDLLRKDFDTYERDTNVAARDFVEDLAYIKGKLNIYRDQGRRR